MKIVCVSDTHGMIKQAGFPQGDVLILAGDILKNYVRNPLLDAFQQEAGLRELDAFVKTLGFKHVLMIAGNHDWLFERNKSAIQLAKNIIYLQDKEIVIDGVKFYGTPWQPEFCGWAFNLPRKGAKLRRVWENIPNDVNVLITHGPPWGILDKIDPNGTDHLSRDVEPLGCELLKERVEELKSLKLHTFGHIHGSYGQTTIDGVVYLNASLCDEGYQPVNPPQMIEIS